MVMALDPPEPLFSLFLNQSLKLTSSFVPKVSFGILSVFLGTLKWEVLSYFHYFQDKDRLYDLSDSVVVSNIMVLFGDT